MTDRSGRRAGGAAGCGSGPGDVCARWHANPFADPISLPSMRERAVVVLERAAVAGALAGRAPDVARGAWLVAAVAAVRMAVTLATSEDDYVLKCDFLREHCARLARHRDGRLALLVEAALEAEADRRRLDGIDAAVAGHRLAIGPILDGPTPYERPVATSHHLAASRLADDWKGATRAMGLLLAEMRELTRRGLSTEGVRRSLADAAFALCLGDGASADDADLWVGLLAILLDAQSEGEPSRAVIRAGMDAERARWGGPVAGRA